MSDKIIQYFKSIGVVNFIAMHRLMHMFLEDQEDWLYVQLYVRSIPITKTQFIYRRWNDFCSYVKNHKDLYFKYLHNGKNTNNICRESQAN